MYSPTVDGGGRRAAKGEINMSVDVEYQRGSRFFRAALFVITILFSEAFVVRPLAAQDCAGGCQNALATCQSSNGSTADTCYDNAESSYNWCAMNANVSLMTCMEDCTQNNNDMCVPACNFGYTAAMASCSQQEDAADNVCYIVDQEGNSACNNAYNSCMAGC
jgi:hypothetical protein